MKETYKPNLMAERLESLKAGIVSAVSFCLVFILASLIFNQFLLKEYFIELYRDSIITLNLQWLISAGIAGFYSFCLLVLPIATLSATIKTPI